MIGVENIHLLTEEALFETGVVVSGNLLTGEVTGTHLIGASCWQVSRYWFKTVFICFDCIHQENILGLINEAN